MNTAIRKIGRWVLLTGILMLAASVLCAFAVGTVAVPILFIGSILVNSAGIMMIRSK